MCKIFKELKNHKYSLYKDKTRSGTCYTVQGKKFKSQN